MQQQAEHNCELPLQRNGSVITIDGPAASGKSSVARAVARELQFLFVSSGSFYRTLAWSAVQQSLDIAQEKAVINWLATLQPTITIVAGEAQLLLNGYDSTDHLTAPSVNALVSPLAALPAVRNFLLALLRGLADKHDLVMEGRDIGSVVFPHAPFKFYLTASIEERMRRRGQQGESDAIMERDQRDTSRALAPLSIPDGAIVIDSTYLSIEEVVEQILRAF